MQVTLSYYAEAASRNHPELCDPVRGIQILEVGLFFDSYQQVLRELEARGWVMGIPKMIAGKPWVTFCAPARGTA